jgi:hypothetical protein
MILDLTITTYLESISLFKVMFVLLGILHLRAGLAYVMQPNKKDTYLSEGFSLGMTKDMGAHFWWLGCMLVALSFVEGRNIQIASCVLLIVGLLVPIMAEYQNIQNGWQSKSAMPRIILKGVFVILAGYQIVVLL